MPSPDAGDRTEAPARHGGLLVAIASGTLLNPLSSSLIAVALVDLARQFELSFASVSWLISVFYLASAVGQPVMGRLGDVFGPRRLFLTGLVVVGLSSAAAPLAPNFATLLAVRALQALGSSAIYPSGMAIIRRVVVEGRARALAVVSVFSSVVAAVGPTLGGYLVAWQGWQATFLAPVPMVVLSLVLGTLVLPPDPPADVGVGGGLRRIDLPGIAAFAITLVGGLFFLISLEQEPAWWALAAAVLAAVAFVAVERRVREPFVDVGALWANHRLTGIYLQYALVNLVFYALFFGVPTFLQQAKGLSAEEAGLVMLAVAGSGLVTTPLAALLVERIGVRPVLLTGAGFLTAGSFALLLITAELSNGAIAAVLAVVGVSVGFNNLALQTAMYDAASADTIGAAAGLFQTSRYVGTILSASVLGLIFGDDIDTAGLHELAWCLGAVSAAVLVLVLFGRGDRARRS